MAEGVPKLSAPNKICHGCLTGKQARFPFPSKSSYRVEAILELVHMDLCGPITPSTLAGNMSHPIFQGLMYSTKTLLKVHNEKFIII